MLEPGLEEALALARGTKQSLIHEGMSATSFTFGVLNIALTAFLLAKWPQHFWLWQTCKCAVLITLSARHRMAQRPNKVYYLFDFCWCANIVLALYGVLAALNLHTVLWPLDLGDTFVATFALANGPLGWSVIMQHNAMVLHSPEHTASLFIHLSPPFLSWSFRWFPALVTRDWASRFGAALSQVSGSSTVTFGRMWSLGALAYVAWFIPYTAWLLAAGRKHSPARNGHDTVWAFSLRTNEAVRKVVGATDGANPDQPLAAVRYMVIHAAGVAVMLCGAMPMWRSFTLHTAYCGLLFVAAVYNGAQRYVKMTTRFYERSLEQALEAAKKSKKSD